MMSNISKQARVVLALVCVVLIGTLLSTCGTDPTTKEVTDIWEAYLVACRAGNEPLARGFFTPESQEYFKLDSVGADYAKRATYEVIKVEPIADYVRMQVVVVRDSVAVGKFKYLVKRDDRYLLQYPFLIFAKNWSVTESEHFRVHCRTTYADSLMDSADVIIDTLTPDTAVLEAFYDTMAFITGNPYPKKIDYYYCRFPDEASLLCGQRGAMGLFFGSCLVDSRRHDFNGLAMLFTDMPDKPVKMLLRGLVAYEDILMRNYAEDIDLKLGARFVQGIMDHPLLCALSFPSPQDDREKYKCAGVTSGFFVKYLIDTYGLEKFAQLYQHSQTEQAFRDQLVAVYGKTLEDFENVLIEIYRPYFSSDSTEAGGM